MRIAVFPGSFDPVTLGHLDVIARASALFDHLVVAVAVNSAKRPLFIAEERVELLRASIEQSNVSVEAVEGLVAPYALSLGAVALVKGVRDAADAQGEVSLALINRHLGIDTVLLPCGREFSHISSSFVREISRYGGDVGELVSPAVAQALAARRGEGSI
ncbi:MAG: pantetheine-phosphate adenylyltransferase [Buchananella hordeovulneris]|nr:pantetheine-phosphate adenylyltransferase [Buchananella hordeovulneris]